MGNDYGMQYIMDGNGNYYTINDNDQLVVARDRDEAKVFSFFEANQRIGGGKKSKFFCTIPVDENEVNSEEPIVGRVMDITTKKEMTLTTEPRINCNYNMENVDWNDFANYYVFLVEGAKGYQDVLAKKHSDIEKEICDLLHYVELYDLTEAEGLKAMNMLKDARQRRRDVKDEISRIEYFMKFMGNGVGVSKAKGFITELKKLDTRKYFPRQIEGLFDGMDDRMTDRETYRNRNNANESIVENGIQEEENVEMSYVETVFDNRDND